jgi:sugar-specific transcriptional regulator TrmB
LVLGVSNATLIAEKSNVVIPRVNDALKRLIKKGYVEEGPELRNPRYWAVHPDIVLEKIEHQLKGKITVSKRLRKQLHHIEKPMLTEPNSLWSVKGEQIFRQALKILAHASKRVMIILPSYSTDSSISYLRKITDILITKKTENPSFTASIALNVNQHSPEQVRLIRKLYRANVTIYRWNTGIVPHGIFLTDNDFIQTFLTSTSPQPSYEQGFFMKNINDSQFEGFQNYCISMYAHQCDKIVFSKANEPPITSDSK